MVLLLKEDNSMAKLAPYTKDMTKNNGKSMAYVCQGFSCNMPTTKTSEMMKMLKPPENR